MSVKGNVLLQREATQENVFSDRFEVGESFANSNYGRDYHSCVDVISQLKSNLDLMEQWEGRAHFMVNEVKSLIVKAGG